MKERSQSSAEAGKAGAGRINQVFCCYSHRDLRHAKRLHIHVDGCQQIAGLTIWDDSQIQAGSHWESEIVSALARSRFAVLLVSADFLASPFITTCELPRLLRLAQSGGTRILPVIVGHCAFEESPLATFQAVNNPARPLSCLPAAAREEIWAAVVRTLIRAVR
jgi:hypothetical protein